MEYIQMKQKSFRHWQWRIVLVAMIGYAMYYFVRKNFSTAMPSLEATFGITRTQLGLFLTVNGIIYGVSRFINGFIADRKSSRVFMACGLMASAILNICFAFSDSAAALISGTASGPEFLKALTLVMGTILLLNGYVQGMGVPPVSPLMSNWIEPEQFATKMSIWNMSHSIGAGLIFLFGAVIVAVAGHDAWRLFFLIPAAVAIMGSIGIYTLLRDRPSDVGFPNIHKTLGNNGKDAKMSDPAFHKAFVNKMVFGNPVIWVLAFTNFLIYIVRFSMLDWGMMLLPGTKGVSVVTAGIMVAVFEFVGGNLGMLAWGWVTDRFFKGCSQKTCLVCVIAGLGAVILLFLLPAGTPLWILYLSFTLVGFCIYGPQALLGVTAIKTATNEASATANGILGITGYLSTTVSGVGLGYLADHFGWTGVWYMIIAAIALSILLLATIWRSPSDGYKAAEIFTADWSGRNEK